MRLLPDTVLPKYEGVEFSWTYNPEMFDYDVTATRGDKKVEFTIHKEWLYLNPPELHEAIEKELEPLVASGPPLQVDLSIKEDEE